MRTGIFRGTWYSAPGVYARVPNIESVALRTVHGVLTVLATVHLCTTQCLLTPEGGGGAFTCLSSIFPTHGMHELST